MHREWASVGKRLAGMLLVVALAAAGCSSGGSDASQRQLSPSELLGLGQAGEGLSLAAEDDYWATQLAIQECMRTQGFDYEAVARPAVPAYSAWQNLSAVEYATHYGYGILTTFVEVEIDRRLIPDPNFAALDSASLAEIRTWIDAYIGTDIETLLGQDLTEIDAAVQIDNLDAGFEPGGCVGEANKRSTLNATYELMNKLEDRLVDLESSITSTQEYQDLDESWAACMASKGFVARTTAAARQPFFTTFFELSTSIQESIGAGGGISLTYDEAILTEGIADEIETAVAEAECEEPLAAERQALRQGLAAEYYDVNPTLFAELLGATDSSPQDPDN